MLWFKADDTRCPRPAKYRAPAWSWAAVEGRVIAREIDDRLNEDKCGGVEECEMVRCEVVLASEEVPFGEVDGGVLEMKASIQKVMWDPTADRAELFMERDNNEGGRERVCIGEAYPDTADECSGDVWAVPVRWNKGRGEELVAGLIVERGSGEEGHFRCVGYFRSPSREASDLGWGVPEADGGHCLEGISTYIPVMTLERELSLFIKIDFCL
ncbi:hypothetical protein SERLA73DRAFT_187984, partial [Serpula lacrymans var. lacrymans S7.3]